MGTPKGTFHLFAAGLLLGLTACQTPGIGPRPSGVITPLTPARASETWPESVTDTAVTTPAQPASIETTPVTGDETAPASTTEAWQPEAAADPLATAPVCTASASTPELELCPVESDCLIDCAPTPVEETATRAAAPVPAIPTVQAAAPRTPETPSPAPERAPGDAALLLFAAAAAIGPLLASGGRR